MRVPTTTQNETCYNNNSNLSSIKITCIDDSNIKLTSSNSFKKQRPPVPPPPITNNKIDNQSKHKYLTLIVLFMSLSQYLFV